MNELIEIAQGFQTSVNIAYDLNNDNKIRNFIPTMSAIEVIEDILLSTTQKKTQRSRILIGAYGRGKSHIILVLVSLLSKKGKDIDKTLFANLLSKIKLHKPELYQYAIEYINSNQRLLPIIVRGSSTSLTQSFLAALQQTLSEEGLSDLMPETHFKAALNQIENWNKNYPDTFDKLVKLLSKSIDDFKLALNEYDVKAYEEFLHLYPALTSGSVFNPFIGFDVVDLYENVTMKLKDKGYNGIYVVYDEFSKYLESSINTTTESDIKLLQDFAEKCNCGLDNQMHLLLITHKDISNYIDSNLPKDKVDGWRGVSGRFLHINLHNNYSQMYEIIAAVIRKNPKLWDMFKEQNANRFYDLKERFTKNGLLDIKNDAEITAAVEKCYPLHPISTFILPRLSEKVAQNERTLFTFLSSDEKFALPSFIKSMDNRFSLLTPDFLYDYFEPLFRKEHYTTEIHKIYKLTTSVLRRVEGKPLHEKILKTIALIYIVEQFEKLAPVVDVIVDSFRDSVKSTKEIDLALKELIDSDCVIYLKRSNNYLKIKETSGVDIQQEIAKTRETILLNKNVSQILNHSVFDSFMYPTAYNDQHDIIRYFDFRFIESEEFWEVKNWDSKISNSKADGTIFAVIPKDQNEIKDIKNAIIKDKNPNSRIVFVLPKKYVDITNNAIDYAAVNLLKDEAASQNDEILNDEYAIYFEDLSEVISEFVNSYARPETGSALYYYKGKENIFRRKAQLSGLLSEICSELFYRTPRINNESINKNDLTSIAINSRTKILSGLLANELSPNLGLTGTGQDVSIMRSTLIQTGILQTAEENPKITLQPDDNQHITSVLKEICNFFTNIASHGMTSFDTLYKILTGYEYGYGLKRGVIPIYIAVVLHSIKSNLVVLYNNKEVKITPELLNDINDSPEQYSVMLEDWNDEKSQYMERLENLFADFVTEREKAYNGFTYIVLAMNRWYLSLPKYAKEATRKYTISGKLENIDSDKRKFINSFKQFDINPREFLFEKVLDIFGYQEFKIGVYENIKATKNEYDMLVNNLIKHLSFEVAKIFSNGKTKGTLPSIIKDWYEELSENTRQYLFKGNENKILDLMSTITNDEVLFIQRLAKTVTYLRIEDWNNDTLDAFLKELVTFKNTIESFNKKSGEKTDNLSSYEIIFTTANGEKIPKRFEKTEYSSRAKLLMNEMTSKINEYGQAISEQEKRQILLELLEKLC